ncbi:WD40 repeat-like protein [Coemansia sp. RSA 990]|nr:actin-interacting protein [Coemansia mojavensis]KAJ1741255.1 WD40 repeat-like protein [Coemansia sp. RSA 1086]KAJ1749517.1 WD40 repeat-like protein [Coemansia sp. RSA 1821]KAJ1871425.1 WD40 repeat-like protein [Coemansia sp. RSA 990]KAJ2668702.1 WD40 repeat-like protein [Coemansia sp. RSA 1085]
MSFEQKEYFAPLPSTERGQPTRLTADPSGENIVYASGSSIVVRSLANPEKAWEYTGHSATPTVARFSPSGYYVASGDSTGKVRVWDAVNPEHILKGEYQPISGRINDIAWDHESKRIMAVGDGKGGFGHVFTYDTGNSVGTVMGHSKVANACTMRQKRPFRAVTCSDDRTAVFFHGAPYKMNTALHEHSGFVQDVRYSPDDARFVTVSADRKIFVYDGQTGELQLELGKDESDRHAGAIYAVAWTGDSKRIVTASGDCTCKVWDVELNQLVKTITIGKGVEHQQVGLVIAGEYIVSLSLSGALNYLQMDADEPVRVVKGHQKSITATALTSEHKLYTASYDGRLCSWDMKGPGEAKQCTGSTGDARVEAAVTLPDQRIAIGSLDNTLRFVDGDKVCEAVGLDAAPRALAAVQDAIIAVLQNDSVVVVRGRQAAAIAVDSTARAVAAADDGTVALGMSDGSVRLYGLEGTKLALKREMATKHAREVTALAFTPDGALLASADAMGKVVLSQAGTGETVTTRWNMHTARVYSLAWSPDASHAASASLDGSVIVWSVETPQRKALIKHAHRGGAASVNFLDNETVVSSGADAGVKVWKFAF